MILRFGARNKGPKTLIPNLGRPSSNVDFHSWTIKISLENTFQIASDWIDFNDCNIKSNKWVLFVSLISKYFKLKLIAKSEGKFNKAY